MLDRQTGSLWSQISGECISGPMEGFKLKQVPAFHTTFTEFIQQFPDGLLLNKPSKGSAKSRYQSYFEDESKLGIFGRIESYNQMDSKSKIYGLNLNTKTIAISEVYLIIQGYTFIESDNTNYIVHYDQQTSTVTAFSLEKVIYDSIGNFEINNKTITSRSKKIAWNLITGQSISGNAPPLSQVPIVSAFWFAWFSFYPMTELIH